MKSIALITANASTITGFRREMVKSLHEKGIKVFALAPNFDEASRAQVQSIGAVPIDCPMSRTGLNPFVDVMNTLKMALILKKLKPDISFGYMIKPVIFGAIAARLAKIPHRFSMVEGLGYVFTSNGNDLTWKRKILQYIVVMLYRVGLAQAEKVFFLNKDDSSELIGYGAIKEEKCFLLGAIGIDLNKWSFSPPVLKPVTFIQVARLLREKGVEDFVNAAKIVKKIYPEARFVLLGGVDLNPNSLSEGDVQEWVREGVLEWPGHVSVGPWMERSSVFVLPSYREGFPVSTQEAMAMGRPVITTNVPGCRETVKDGENGFLVPVRDSQALAVAMMKFLKNPELVSIMGSLSREIAEKRFDVHKINETIFRELKVL